MRGTVRIATGEVPRVAHIVLNSQDAHPIKMEPDGSFELHLLWPGIHQFYVTSPNHEHTLVWLALVDRKRMNDEIELQITMRRPEYLPNPSTIEISGTWDAERHAAIRQQDGTFVYEVETDADTIGYSVWGLIAAPHSTNGSLSDRYAYDGDGDYYSVLDLSSGRARIVVDPAKMDRRQTVEAGFKFDPAHAGQETVQGVIAAAETAEAILKQQMLVAAGLPEPPNGEARLAAAIAALDGWEQDADTPIEARQLAFMYRQRIYSRMPDPDTQDSAGEHLLRLLQVVPPESALWDKFATNLMALTKTKLDYAARKEHALRVFDAVEWPDSRIQVLNVLLTLAKMAHAQQDLESFYARLKEDYGDAPTARFALTQFNPDPPVAPGKPFPEFTAKRLSGEPFDSRDYHGHVVLYDFWSTGCVPCVAAIPELEKIWADYSDRGLKMVSVALDRNPQAVEAFRRRPGHQMPWDHALLTEGWKAAAARKLGLSAIPTVILVDAEGRVVFKTIGLLGVRTRLDQLLPAGKG